jgi:hypothetical protein
MSAVLEPAAAPTPTAPPQKPYSIRGVPVELLSRFWPYATPYIKRALDRATGEFSLDDVHRFARDAQIQLWLVYDGERICGAATTEIVRFSAKNRLRVLTVGGEEFDLWAPALDRKLREWALTHKCDGIEAYVRKGFVTKLRSLGYRHKISQVWKPIAAKENAA